jgi:hypothetical protein
MAVAIHDGSVSKKEKVLQLALKSPVHYGQLFLQADFKIETASAYHYEVGYIMDDKKFMKPTIYMLPRGHAKTKLTQASILKDITTYEWDEEAMKRWFIVWVAQNKTQSMRNVNFIMNQIETNNKIKYYFGDLRGTGKHKWNQEELEFRNDCSLICRAGLHGIRGLLKDELRPNRFILDDFEYEGNTKTQHSRNANAETVTSVILPGLDPEYGRLQINQTPVHYDAFVMRIWDSYQEFIKEGGDPDHFEWHIYKKSTKIGNPLWKEYFNSALLRRRKAQLIQAGQLHTWFQEYEMEVTTDETALFGKKVLQYWDGELLFQGETPYLHITSINHEMANKKVPVLIFQGCDPSSDIETRTSSDTAIIDIAVDADGNIYSLDYLCKKNLPDIALDKDPLEMGTANQILKRCHENKARRSGVEKHAVSAGVFNSIAKVKEQQPIYQDIVVVPLSHKGERKIDRIYNGLIAEFNSKKIFIKESHVRLEKEINTFGEFAKYIDLLDALEMAKRVSYKPSIQEIEEDNSIPMDPWEVDNLYKRETHNWKTV